MFDQFLILCCLKRLKRDQDNIIFLFFLREAFKFWRKKMYTVVICFLLPEAKGTKFDFEHSSKSYMVNFQFFWENSSKLLCF